MILSYGYRETQGLFEAVNHHAKAAGMRIDVSKTKKMSALVPCEQHQAVLPDGEPSKDVEKYRHLGSIFIANGQGTEKFRSRINPIRSGFFRLQSCLWLRREISLRREDRVNQAVV